MKHAPPSPTVFKQSETLSSWEFLSLGSAKESFTWRIFYESKASSHKPIPVSSLNSSKLNCVVGDSVDSIDVFNNRLLDFVTFVTILTFNRCYNPTLRFLVISWRTIGWRIIGWRIRDSGGICKIVISQDRNRVKVIDHLIDDVTYIRYISITTGSICDIFNFF